VFGIANGVVLFPSTLAPSSLIPTQCVMDLHDIMEDGAARSSSSSFMPPNRHRPTSEPVLMSYYPTSAAPPNSKRLSRSSVRVSVDFFDPVGVQELSHFAERDPNPRRQSRRESRRQSRRHSQLQAIPADSDATLIPSDGPFDFEKTLKIIQGRCA
jgi:hypothetical protein